METDVVQKHMKIAIELSNLKAELSRDFDGTLSKVAECGYRTVSTKDLFGISADDLGKKLDQHGLQAFAISAIQQELLSRPDCLAEEAKALGAKWVHIRHLYLDSFGEGWKRAGSRFTAVADHLNSLGISLAYHNHEKEFKSDDGEPNIDAILSGGGPLLYCNFDVFHCQAAHEDPAKWIRRIGPKVKSLQIQDTDGKEGAPIGDGNVEWRAVFDAGNEQGAEVAVVDLTVFPNGPMKALKSSHDFLVSMGLED